MRIGTAGAAGRRRWSVWAPLLVVACAHGPGQPSARGRAGDGQLDGLPSAANEPRPWCGHGVEDSRADAMALGRVVEVWQATSADRALEEALREPGRLPPPGDGGERKQQDGELALGRALACMGLPSIALEVFDDIGAQGPGHPHYLEAARWLVRLSYELPAGSGLLAATGRYQRADLDAPVLADVKPEAALLLARGRYEEGRRDETLELLALVPPTSPLHVRAKLLEGATHVRSFRAAPAAAAFAEAARASHGAREPERLHLHELAIISLARLFYSTGQFAVAQTYYDGIPAASPFRAESLFEAAWTRLMANDRAQALASLAVLEEVDAGGVVKPESAAEALVLKAALHDEQGLAERAAAELDRARSTLSSIFTELKQLLEANRRDAPMLEVARQLRGGAAAAGGALSPATVGYVRNALFDPAVGRSFARLAQLDDELRRCREAGEPWMTSPAGRHSVATLTERRGAAAHDSAELARRRLRRLGDEIAQLLKRMILDGDEPLDARSDGGGRLGYAPDHP